MCVRVLLLKALHAARSVYKLLFAGEKWVAVRADFDTQHVAFNGRACWKSVAASTVHGHSVIIGVNSGFHDSPFYFAAGLRDYPERVNTVASLGRKANFNCTGNESVHQILRTVCMFGKTRNQLGIGDRRRRFVRKATFVSGAVYSRRDIIIFAARCDVRVNVRCQNN